MGCIRQPRSRANRRNPNLTYGAELFWISGHPSFRSLNASLLAASRDLETELMQASKCDGLPRVRTVDAAIFSGRVAPADSGSWP
jgi:hypothetical protein